MLRESISVVMVTEVGCQRSGKREEAGNSPWEWRGGADADVQGGGCRCKVGEVQRVTVMVEVVSICDLRPCSCPKSFRISSNPVLTTTV